MNKLWLNVRSALLWTVSGIHFFFSVLLLVLVAIFVDPKKSDWLQRAFCRNILRFAGAKLEVRRAPGFDPNRTCFLLSNHVNLFDPFVLYAAIPQFARGLELESHFKIPVYGMLMKRFGNVPVPDVRRPSDLKRMRELTRAALESGTSLIVFPEAKRTLNGRVDEFEAGAFRMAQQWNYPIVPVSMVGSFEFHRKGDWLLRPATITVYLHDTIETSGLSKEDVPALRDRVRAIIAEPVDAYYAAREQCLVR